jgi:hypothetical protein
MDDQAEVIIIEDDERNAPARRYPAGRRPTPIMGRRVPASSIGRPGYPYPYPPQGGRWWPPGAQAPGYYPPQAPPQSTVIVQQPASRPFAGMTTGELVEAGAALLAAIQPLPGAPSSTGHGETDMENLVIYQTALATHAKRDEQLRTLGALLGRFLNANQK